MFQPASSDKRARGYAFDSSSSWELQAWDTLSPVLLLPVGEHDIILYVWDQDYGTGMDIVHVEVNEC